MERSEIEARARAEARRRDELARAPSLEAEVAELEERAQAPRRLAASLAGSRLAGLLAGDRSLTAGAASDVEREAAELRRRRFRLTRRRRVLERGAAQPPQPARSQHTKAGQREGEPPRNPSRAGPLSFCIRIAGRDWESADRGGDAALARSLARALGARGHEAVVQLDSEAGDPQAESLDILLALRGRPVGEPTPRRLNLLWLISHPDEAGAGELERYDRVLVASNRYAEQLRGTIQTPVEPLLQFADPTLFHPAPGAGPEHDVLFVGNWRGEFRRIVWDAIEAGHPPALYGRGWDLLAPEHAVAEHVPHAELHRLYSSCEVLLCDHWEDMRRHGFVSNKVLDALASGAFVIADDNPGLAELLPGGVETYSSQAELAEKIERYRGNPAARRRIAERGRAMTLAGHTAARRAEQLVAIAAATARECGRPALAHLREPPSGRPADGASVAAGAWKGADAG